MRIGGEKVKSLCRERHKSLKALLAEAGVSRTAYYSLLRKNTILPRSVERIARCLAVSPAKLLDDEVQSALDISLGDFSIKVLPLDRIIASKTFLNRQKDRVVLPALKSAAKALAATVSRKTSGKRRRKKP